MARSGVLHAWLGAAAAAAVLAGPAQAAPPFQPLPQGRFCAQPVVPNAFADISPCTGAVRPGGGTFTARLRRPIAAPLRGSVWFQPYDPARGVIRSAAVVSGRVLSGAGTGVNSDYTLEAPAQLCVNTGVTYLVSLPGLGAIGLYRPDCAATTPAPGPAPGPGPAAGPYRPLPTGQFCAHPMSPGAFADIYPCTGKVLPGGAQFTARLRRPLKAPLALMTIVSFQPWDDRRGAVSSAALVRGRVIAGTGTAVNSEYTIFAPQQLCANTGVKYMVSTAATGAIGFYYPDCRG